MQPHHCLKDSSIVTLGRLDSPIRSKALHWVGREIRGFRYPAWRCRATGQQANRPSQQTACCLLLAACSPLSLFAAEDHTDSNPTRRKVKELTMFCLSIIFSQFILGAISQSSKPTKTTHLNRHKVLLRNFQSIALYYICSKYYVLQSNFFVTI